MAAQTFTTLHSFTALLSGTNSDGAYPYAVLILSGNTLYGTAYDGGSAGVGTVFKVNTDGTGFTNLHSFTAPSGSSSGPSFTNSEGATPYAGLILSGNTLYGTAYYGGSAAKGTVFAVNTNGAGFTNLHDFLGYPSDGANPFAGLILSGNTLYGTASVGGSSGYGTVFKVNTNGTGFTNLHSFTASSGPSFTNNDGAHPSASLIMSGNTLYGTAIEGGSSGAGTVFAVNTNGTGFTNLYSFTAPSGNSATNSDGAVPYGLILWGNTLYGTAFYGGYGGISGEGTVFAVNTNGTGFTNLHSFLGYPSDGAFPYAGLVLSGNTLYGTAQYGGSSDEGTVFSLSFAPQLTIFRSGTNVTLTWPTNVAGFSYAGFALQSTTNLLPVAWSAVSPAPVVVNGQNAVTNPISGTQQFYRLSQ